MVTADAVTVAVVAAAAGVITSWVTAAVTRERNRHQDKTDDFRLQFDALTEATEGQAALAVARGSEITRMVAQLAQAAEQFEAADKRCAAERLQHEAERKDWLARELQLLRRVSQLDADNRRMQGLG